MTNHFEAIVTAIIASFTVFSGNQIAQSVGTSDPMTGVVGTAMLVAIGGGVVTWLVVRLGKADDREQKRMDRHEETITKLVEMGTANRIVIEQNSKLLERVEVVINKCPKP